MAGGSTVHQQRQQKRSSVIAHHATKSDDNIVHIDDSNYHRVINGDKPVLIDAYTQWYVPSECVTDLWSDAVCCS